MPLQRPPKVSVWNHVRRPSSDEETDLARQRDYWTWNDASTFSDLAMAIWDIDAEVSWHLIETSDQADFEAHHMKHSVGYNFDHYSDMAKPSSPEAALGASGGGIFSLRRKGTPFATILVADAKVVHAVGVANVPMEPSEYAYLEKVCERTHWALPDRHALAGHVAPADSEEPRETSGPVP